MTKPKTVNKKPKTAKRPAPPKVAAVETWSSIRPPQVGASKAGWHRISSKFECDKKYQLAEVWQVRQPASMTGDALAVGGLFHGGRAHWFESGFPTSSEYQRALEHYVRDHALVMALPVREDAINRTLSYLHQYIEYWSSRLKPEVIGVEYDLQAPVIPGMDNRTARLDDVSKYPEHNFHLCIGECKTTSENVNAVVNEYTMHGQPMLQSILWEMAANGAPLHGVADAVLLDVVVKGYGKEKCQFGRVPIRITDYMKNWFLASLGRHVREAQLMTTESSTVGMRNPLSCTRQIGRMRVPCQYRDLCQRGKSAAVSYVDMEGESLASAKYTDRKGAKPWD